MNMREMTPRLLVLLAGLAWPLAGQAQDTQDTCIACHRGLSDERLAGPAQQLAGDVHSAKGFSCVICHGGDAEEFSMAAMDPARGYLGVPSRGQISGLCGRCHSDANFMRRFNPSLRVDQVAEYYTSVHGRRLREDGDTRVATCVSCHPAHSIKPRVEPSSSVNPLNVAETCSGCHADSEYMAPYGIPTDQHAKYLESVHWEKMAVEGDLSAPTCNDCHGNHGASPPGVGWVGNVCGQCHTVMAELFNASPHSRVFAMLGNPGCATCHRNHEIKAVGEELLGLGEGSVCAMCHAEGDAGGIAASGMRALIDSLNAQLEAADSILARAENAGMEVSGARFGLVEATTALVSARTAVHGFSLDAVSEEVGSGLEATAAAYADGMQALRDLQFRRLGLAVSVAIILALIAGLVLKIRSLEGRG
jgi:hypothetical protein